MADRDESSVHLPRTLVGGLRKGPVEDLLRRIAHDYEQLELENRKLWATLEQIGGPKPPAPGAGDLAEPTVALPIEAPGGEGPSEPDPAVLPLEMSSPQPEREDLAAAVLLLAQRSANELRASARAECELMIKKARAHLDKLERESEQSRAATAAELAELLALKSELREHMRGSLQALLRTFVAERSGGQASFEWREPPAFLQASEPDRTGKKKKKHRS